MREDRPGDLSPHTLGFTPQRAVPWLNPRLLAGTGIRTVFSDLFGAYLDKREMQAVLGDNRHDHSGADGLWLDYTADVGDGFDATFSIASLMARPVLEIAGPDGGAMSLPAAAFPPPASLHTHMITRASPSTNLRPWLKTNCRRRATLTA